MGFFKKRKDILDLTEKYKKQQEKVAEMKQDIQDVSNNSQESNSTGLGIFGMPVNRHVQEIQSEPVTFSSSEDKRRKLAKRLKDMTEKIEDLSNQIYHLQQRLEVLEKKSEIRY